MKELTEAERKLHLANCCRWRYDGYTIDDEGMPNKCFLTNETNPYLPRKVQMVPKRTCENMMPPSEKAILCSECGNVTECYSAFECRKPAFCGVCGAEVVDD